MEENKDTYFAPAYRIERPELQQNIDLVSHSPVIDALMKCISGLFAVLNEQRQIVALNETLLKMLGINNPDEIFGSRPGEAIHCIHSDELPGGCGTSKYCSTCGAAISIVAALTNKKPEERKCVLTVEKDGAQKEICFKVRACPFNIENQNFILIFLQDITDQERWESLEMSFFHDINNIISALTGTVELMTFDDEDVHLAHQINNLITRLSSELEIQRSLMKEEIRSYNPVNQETTLNDIIDELMSFIESSACSVDKHVKIEVPENDKRLFIDKSLLVRILSNMLINAVEASEKGDEVKVWIEEDSDNITFFVHNKQFIPEDIRLRIFQRYFSTKKDYGRGFGTYAMKFFGEEILKSKVGFTSSEDEGTTFYLALPVEKFCD